MLKKKKHKKVSYRETADERIKNNKKEPLNTTNHRTYTTTDPENSDSESWNRKSMKDEKSPQGD